MRDADRRRTFGGMAHLYAPRRREHRPAKPARGGQDAAVQLLPELGEEAARDLAAAGFATLASIASAGVEDLLAGARVGPITAARLKARAGPAPATDPAPASPMDDRVREMLDLCHGMIRHGLVTPEETLMLAHWGEAHPDVLGRWPASALAARIDRICVSGRVDEGDRRDLEAIGRALGTGAASEAPTPRRSGCPLDDPPPALLFGGWEYVFAGVFAGGTHRWCRAQVESRGGTTASEVSGRTRVLVVGTYGACGDNCAALGTHVRRAVDYRAGAAGLTIVDEAHWTGHLRPRRARPG
jgi:NAD-dependent DNA ligase